MLPQAASLSEGMGNLPFYSMEHGSQSRGTPFPIPHRWREPAVGDTLPPWKPRTGRAPIFRTWGLTPEIARHKQWTTVNYKKRSTSP